jgi:hypothetical protein
VYIDFSEAPKDPIERLVWLSGARRSFEDQIEPYWQSAYFEARLTQRLDNALHLRFHSRKRVMAWTRAENERRGRIVRWNDGRG